MRLRLCGEREQHLGAASLPCFPGHVVPPLRIADSLLQGSRRVNCWIFRRGYAKNLSPCEYARREIASADQKAALRSCSSCRGEKKTKTGMPIARRMREIPMSKGLTRPIRTREKNAPTTGMTRFPLSPRETRGCFCSKRIVETQVMKYTNARRNTAELMRSVRPPSKLAT